MEIDIPAKLQFLFKPKRFKVMFGGRGGYKTMSISKALPFMAAREKKRILCCREYMNSIEDSVHASISDEIEKIGLSPYYEVMNNEIRGKNGSYFKYFGLARNLSSIKSKYQYDIAWVEEAETISQKSLDVLIPTIVRTEGAEIWFSFNPDDEFGPVYSHFVKPYMDEIRSKGFYEDETLYVVKTSLLDNPFAPAGLLDESAKMKAANIKKWLHIYGGECYSDYKDSIIQPEWFDAAIDAHVKLGYKPMGIKSMGFDLADTGDDKAMMFRHGPVITQGVRWSDGELPEAIDKAFAFAEEHRAEYMVYDDDGLGKSMKVYLANVTTNKLTKIFAHNGNAAVDNPGLLYPDDPEIKDRKKNRDVFKNRRSQYIWLLRDRFEATFNAVKKGIYTDPQNMISISSKLEDLDVLKSEVVKIERKRGNNSLIQIKGKREKAADGAIPKSPNMFDALYMCFSNPEPEPETKIIDFTSEF